MTPTSLLLAAALAAAGPHHDSLRAPTARRAAAPAVAPPALPPDVVRKLLDQQEEIRQLSNRISELTTDLETYQNAVPPPGVLKPGPDPAAAPTPERKSVTVSGYPGVHVATRRPDGGWEVRIGGVTIPTVDVDPSSLPVYRGTYSQYGGADGCPSGVCPAR